jgi:transcriptional regulator NrdR family protein
MSDLPRESEGPWCPYCQSSQSKVTDSRYSHQRRTRRRVRACKVCNKRFATHELVAPSKNLNNPNRL